METFVQAIVSSLPASTARLGQYSKSQEENSICSQIITFCQSDWPKKSEISTELQLFAQSYRM